MRVVSYQFMSTPFIDRRAEPGISGFLHTPSRANGSTIILTHGAGANCNSKLLVQMSEAFAAAGFMVLRFDLPFRQARPHGPPFRGSAAKDREGLRRAVTLMKERLPGPVFLGGHSYGGRQASMLVAEDAQLVSGLLLLSYPLHPPRKPGELRTGHFPKLTTPAFFVHGTRDPFGSIDEMKAALKLIPGLTALLASDGVGHELLSKKSDTQLTDRIVIEFQEFFSQQL
jgi:predicted alpha/beta-hydrolase family hydrolase